MKLGGGYADWVLVALHGLREHLDQPYRRLLDVLHEMPGIVSELGHSTAELPDFTTVCTRKQDLEMAVRRVLLRLSAALHDLGEIQAIDSTSFAYRSSSRNYAKRVTDRIFASITDGMIRSDGGVVSRAVVSAENVDTARRVVYRAAYLRF